MAWTAPMTAVTGNAFTAAQFNTHIRDNLLETAPAKATTAGGYFVATATNAIAQRTIGLTSVVTSTTADVTSYAVTGTPVTVTVTTGTSAIIALSANVSSQTSIGQIASVGFAVSGATTIAATADRSYEVRLYNSSITGDSGYGQGSWVGAINTLNAGSNTFTLQYKTTAATGTIQIARRHLTIIPL